MLPSITLDNLRIIDERLYVIELLFWQKQLPCKIVCFVLYQHFIRIITQVIRERLYLVQVIEYVAYLL